MFKNILLWPGRVAARLTAAPERKSYRSPRKRRPQEAGPGVILVSVLVWLIIAGGLVWASGQLGGQSSEPVPPVASNEGQPGAAPENPPEGQGGSPLVAGANNAVSGTNSGDAAAPAAEGQQPQTGAGGGDAAAQPTSEAWLVILNTLPQTAYTEAERRKEQYEKKGLKVEIIDTTSYPRLIAGNWILAQGPYESRQEAENAAMIAKEFSPGLMVRRGL